MNKEYIEREAALQFKLTRRSEKITVAQAVSDAITAYIESIPAADVVEVVRCKDCKHLCIRSAALGVYKCAIHGDYPSGEYFCADGERGAKDVPDEERTVTENEIHLYE